MNIKTMFDDYKIKAQILIDTGELYKRYAYKLKAFIDFVDTNTDWSEELLWQYEGYIDKIDSLLKEIKPEIVERYTTKVKYEMGILKRDTDTYDINAYFEELMRGFK